MNKRRETLRGDALAIWQAGVDAVRSDRLVQETVRVAGGQLQIGDQEWPLSEIRRIVVVGAGKAGAGMAAGLEVALGDAVISEKQLAGWINTPEDCVRALKRIKLHGARPTGVNEPTAAGVAGAERILSLVESLQPEDLCICLISGGGSALLPAPAHGIGLADKLAVTRHLSAAGANIQELNTVRKQLSRIKGGRLARACRAGRLVTLIISDVVGDPLDVIASGPTVQDASTPRQALEVLERFQARQAGISPAVFQYLEGAAKEGLGSTDPLRCHVTNLIIGNNAAAVDASGAEAVRRGYSPAMTAARELEGAAEEVGRHLADMAVRMSAGLGPDCLITGGEPVVKLVSAERRGLGGRNQQLVLAALEWLLRCESGHRGEGRGAYGGSPLERLVLLSGGTDGEDGPTDAAGALADASVVAEMRARGLDPSDFLRRNDAYHFFEPLGGLIKTGPTHTNVCDVRVVTVDRDD